MIPATRKLKQAIQRGERVFGTMMFDDMWPGFVELLKRDGYDFIVVDTEHAIVNGRDLTEVMRTGRLVDIPILLRPADHDYHLLANHLDAGAQGGMVPRVNNEMQVDSIISSTKLPPLGTRGAGGFGQLVSEGGLAQEVREANDNIVIIQIETEEAVETADEILAAGPIDGVIIGPADLSISLGVPMEWHHPKMRKAIQHVIQACARQKVASGIHYGSPAVLKELADDGMTLLLCSTPVAMFMERSAQVAAEMAAICGREVRQPQNDVEGPGV
jgi:2-keto-3-deoxy-L-rhamnonate aldolase RhmA